MINEAPQRLRPLRLAGLTLTNVPNNRGGKPISTITNRNSTGAPSIESLSPQAASEEFSKIVNRLQSDRGGTFQSAWDDCRRTEAALYNRMAAKPQASSQPRGPKPEETFAKYAGDALYAMAEHMRVTNRCTFADAWPLVCNRRRDLFRLANRELPQEAWAVLEDQAFDKWTSERQLDPDGRPMSKEPPEAIKGYFERDYNGYLRREPNLGPRAIWDKIKQDYPHIYWPFVAVTAQ